MAVRLFIGNLAYEVTEAELRAHFEALGPLASFALPTDRDTGTPRGFAFVEFRERADAEDAIRRLNNQLFKGRPLAVSEARARDAQAPPRAPRPRPHRARRTPALQRAGTSAPMRRRGAGVRRRSVRRPPSAARSAPSISAPSDRGVSAPETARRTRRRGAATTRYLTTQTPPRTTRSSGPTAVYTHGMPHTREDQDGTTSASDLSKA